MTSIRGHDAWAKVTSTLGKITALVCHPTKKYKINQAQELNLSLSNIGENVAFNDTQ
jgi:hypothetical protein